MLQIEEIEKDTRQEKEAIEEKEIKIQAHIKKETILRNTATNYIRLICNADRKARNMLLVNSFFLAASVTLLSNSLVSLPNSWISSVLLLATNLFSLFFILQSVRPNFSLFKHPDLENNLIHYKKCSELTLGEYMQQMKETMADNEKSLEAVLKDLYYYGNLLNIKYRLIRQAYRIFTWGMFLSISSYLLMLLIES